MPDIKLLVAYASRGQSTAEIAMRIAGKLRDAAMDDDVRRIDDIASVVSYDAVVLGCRVYDGS